MRGAWGNKRFNYGGESGEVGGTIRLGEIGLRRPAMSLSSGGGGGSRTRVRKYST